MFASIRKEYKIRRGSVEHLAQRVQDGFVRWCGRWTGFAAIICSTVARMLITISIFDSPMQRLPQTKGRPTG